MSSAGAFLRELREARGVSLDEIARLTRIGSPQLDALERDDYAGLPAPVFIKGFIRAYCQALSVAPEDALGRFEQSGWTGLSPVARGAVMAPRVRSARRGHVLVSLALLVVLGGALAAVTLLLRPHRGRDDRAAVTGGAGPRSIDTTPRPAGTPVAAAPATAQAEPMARVAGPAETAQAAPTPAASRPAVTVSPPASMAEVAAKPGEAAPAVPVQGAGERKVAAPGAPGSEVRGAEARASRDAFREAARYRVVARASEATWVRVRTDEGQTVEETIPPGQTREWRSNAPLVITIGNAGGVSLELNGRPLPPLGERGAVVRGLIVPSSGS